MSPISERLYLSTSGEHGTLPLSEIVAILDGHHSEYRLLNNRFKLVELNAPLSAGELVAKRAAYVDEAGIELFTSRPDFREISKMMGLVDFDRFVKSKDTFDMRVSRYGTSSKDLSRVQLERELGALIASQTGLRVDLEQPVRKFRGILTDGVFHFGLQMYHRVKGSVANRRPRKRAVFHPSTMVPKLARCLVNLAGVTEKTTFLDPFCGVGGILLEASMLGCQVVGIDALPKMVRGTRKNLAQYKLESLGIIRADSRKLPLREIDAIATDPPYGTGASTLKATTRDILDDFLPQARTILRRGARAVVVSPLGTGVADLAEEDGFKVLETHRVYVHSSLTREILVLQAA